MEYLKSIHVAAVTLSFCGFFMRGIWMLQSSDLLQKKYTKILPHIVESILLGSALIMLYLTQWSIVEHHWLQMKVAALLIYIGLGMLALKFGRTLRVRLLAWLSGLFVFMFMVSVALSKSALGFVGFLNGY